MSPDLMITKTVATNTINFGATTTFTLIVSTNIYGAASGSIQVTDILPTGLTYVSAIGTNWSCTSAIVCNYTGVYPVAASTTLPSITVTVQANATGSITNYATTSLTATSSSSEATTTNNTASATLNVLPLGTIGNQVFFDQDANGIYSTSTGDTGIANVTVELYNGLGVLLSSTTTNANGNYLFTGLLTGINYIVKVATSSLPIGINIQTFGTVGVDNNGQVNSYTVTTSTSTANINYADFGFASPAIVITPPTPPTVTTGSIVPIDMSIYSPRIPTTTPPTVMASTTPKIMVKVVAASIAESTKKVVTRMNKKARILAKTGYDNRNIIYMSGGIILLTGFILFAFKKREEREEK